MTTGSHPQQTESEGIHQPFNWIWADSTERLAETVTALDINKEGLQQSDNSRWVLTAVTPTWVQTGNVLVQPGSGTDSVMIGSAIDASGQGSIVVGGEDGEATGDDSAVLGGLRGTADGVGSATIAGEDCYAPYDYSYASGLGAVAANRGERAHSSGYISLLGDTKHGDAHVFRSVTHSDANWYTLFTDGSSSPWQLGGYSVITFEALIVGATSALGKTFSFKIQGSIKNTAGTIALSGTPTVTTISNGDDVSFEAQAVADDPNDALAIQVRDTDGGGDTVQWSAVIKFISVTALP